MKHILLKHKKQQPENPALSSAADVSGAGMVQLPGEDACTGCGACAAVCSQNAIVMEEGLGGFLYPSVNKEVCTKCGACTAHCPVYQAENSNFKSPECYAVQAADAQREESSSGGFAAVLASHVIAQGGYVCGAAFVSAVSVQHILIHTQEEIPKLTGVKYTQSTITADTFRSIRDLLEQGETVLFIGCPCQVAGVYGFLGKRYENLYTVDIVCRGVSSEKMIRQYLREAFPEKEAASVAYRNKKKYGWSSSLTVQFTDGTEFREKCDQNLFFDLFLSDYSVRPSCGSCAFTGMPRQGDLTCGDLWSVKKFHPQWHDKKGTSFVLTNNQKGEQLYRSLGRAFHLEEKIPLSEASHGNRVLLERAARPVQADRFLAGVGRVPLERLLRLCRENHYDVGVVGLWYGLNYGSVLTYYALYQLLHDMGYEAMFVEKPDFLWSSRYASHDTLAHRFIRKRCNVGKHRVNAEDWRIQGEQCDTFVIGSDVVWNYEICGRSSGNFLFLDFVPDGKKKLAYAASFGGGYNAPEWLHRQNRYYLQKFDGVSVREDAAVRICDKQFGVSADKVLDPVFLCDMKWFRSAAEESGLELPERYVMSYILGGSESKRKFIQNAAQHLQCEMRNVVNPNEPETCQKALKLPAMQDPSVEDWLKLVQNCTLFIGDSFHGLCFSLLFRRQFVCLIRKNMPSRDRFQTLLRICGLEERLLYVEQDNSDKLYLLDEAIDYDAVERRLQPYREQSLTWLRTHMELPPQALQAGTQEEMEKRLNAMQYEIYALQRELESLRHKKP